MPGFDPFDIEGTHLDVPHVTLMIEEQKAFVPCLPTARP